MSGDERVIRCVDCNAESFLKSLKRLKSADRLKEVQSAIRSVLLARWDELPKKLHFHQLANKKVCSVLKPGEKVPAWSMHVTPDDTLKASFTFEDGTIYLRRLDEHDALDKNP